MAEMIIPSLSELDRTRGGGGGGNDLSVLK